MAQEIFHGAGSETGRAAKIRRGKVAKPANQKLPSEVNSRGWRRSGRWGRVSPAGSAGAELCAAAPRRERAGPRPRGGSAGEPRYAKEPRLNHAARTTNRLENGPTEQQEWTFFIFDNLCPKETILKIIEMITIHCCLTLSKNSQIMKS